MAYTEPGHLKPPFSISGRPLAPRPDNRAEQISPSKTALGVGGGQRIPRRWSHLPPLVGYQGEKRTPMSVHKLRAFQPTPAVVFSRPLDGMPMCCSAISNMKWPISQPSSSQTDFDQPISAAVVLGLARLEKSLGRSSAPSRVLISFHKVAPMTRQGVGPPNPFFRDLSQART